MSQPDAETPGPSPARVRASDVDREAVVGTLHDAFTRGLLTMEECDERMAAAYSARYVDDLPSLTADLPPAPAAAPVAPGWRALAALAWLQLRTALAGISWRSVRSRPRLALAAVALLALLAFGAVTAADGFDHPGPVDHAGWFEHGGHELRRG